MLKPISELGNAQVVDFDKSRALGRIINWVINPDKKQISAFMVKPQGIWRSVLAISTADIIEYGPKMVVVKNENALVPPREIVHLPKLIRHRHKVLGNPVITQSGKRLGNVTEILFETIDATIQKIYVQRGLLGLLNQPDLIIGVDKIIRIDPRRIIIQDDSGAVAAVKKTAPLPT